MEQILFNISVYILVGGIITAVIGFFVALANIAINEGKVFIHIILILALILMLGWAFCGLSQSCPVR